MRFIIDEKLFICSFLSFCRVEKHQTIARRLGLHQIEQNGRGEIPLCCRFCRYRCIALCLRLHFHLLPTDCQFASLSIFGVRIRTENFTINEGLRHHSLYIKSKGKDYFFAGLSSLHVKITTATRLFLCKKMTKTPTYILQKSHIKPPTEEG